MLPVQQFSGNTRIPMQSQFPANQDRSLDPGTVAWWCVGCPYLHIGPQPYQINPNNNTAPSNTTTWQSVGQANAVFQLKTQYYCGSPKQTQFQQYTQQHSTIGFAFCPFLEQKLALIPDHSED